MASLVIITGPDQGRTVTLERPITIGRMAGCGLHLSDGLVSRQHARLTPGGGDRGAELADLGSANGTWVNGDMIQGDVTLNDGDEITVGRTVMRFSSVVPRVPLDSPQQSAERTPAWKRTTALGAC